MPDDPATIAELTAALAAMKRHSRTWEDRCKDNAREIAVLQNRLDALEGTRHPYKQHPGLR
jgi:hypothetical protein